MKSPEKENQHPEIDLETQIKLRESKISSKPSKEEITDLILRIEKKFGFTLREISEAIGIKTPLKGPSALHRWKYGHYKPDPRNLAILFLLDEDYLGFTILSHQFKNKPGPKRKKLKLVVNREQEHDQQVPTETVNILDILDIIETVSDEIQRIQKFQTKNSKKISSLIEKYKIQSNKLIETQIQIALAERNHIDSNLKLEENIATLEKQKDILSSLLETFNNKAKEEIK